jgi:hypothetical protein
MRAIDEKESPSPATQPRRSPIRALGSSPTVGLAFGAVGIIATFLAYWLSLASVEPVYRVSGVEVMARKESPRLGVTWDGTPIGNLCVCRLAIWNNGKLPIRHSDLPASDPLRIVPTKTIQILAVEPVNLSRANLRLGVVINSGRKDAEPSPIVHSPRTEPITSVVYLNILGGDALERFDGAAFRVLFTGDCSATFRVEGRVVGTKSGFRLVSGAKAAIGTGWETLLIASAFVLMLGQQLHRLRNAIKHWRRSNMSLRAKLRRWHRVCRRDQVGITVAFLGGVGAMLFMMMRDMVSAARLPDWLPF